MISGLVLVFAAFCAPLKAQQQYATAGVLERGGQWEVGITFHVPVDPATALVLANYSLPAGTLEDLRLVPETGSIVLTVDGLSPGNLYSVALRNLEDASGNPLPPLSLSFETRLMSWSAIGTQELDFLPDAVAVGESGFDLVSGGIQLWDRYDETTFVHQRVTGSFDVAVRIEHQDPSSQWARAGLMVRETLDENKPRPADPFDPAQAFSRYIDVHANPALAADGTPANNLHEVNIRPYTGGIGSPNFDATENPPLSNNAAPAYPNVWLRIKRSGQAFTIYRGTDGTTWTEMGTFTFPTTDAEGNPVPPFPATVYVGPHYSPENGNIPGGLRGPFVARFRDYSVEARSDPASGLAIRRLGQNIEVSWTGTAILQRTPSLLPVDWADLPNAVSPHVIPAAGQAFFRLKEL